MLRFDCSILPNLLLDFPNSNFGRNRSPTENFVRIGANAFPIGRFADGIANGVELGGHLANHNYNCYYQNNARNYTDNFERGWDAYKRSTDIDYS